MYDAYLASPIFIHMKPGDVRQELPAFDVARHASVHCAVESGEAPL